VIKYLLPIVLLLLLVFRFISQEKAVLRDGQNLSFTSRLTSEPQNKKASQSFQLFFKDNRINVITNSSGYSYGDLLSVTGKLKVNSLKNGNEYLVLYYPKIQAKKDQFAQAYAVRQKIISVFEGTLPSDYAALMLGIVFGIKTSISSELLSDLKILGLMHIIAASGMNVTLIAGFLSSVFLLFLKRQIALLLTIFGIVIYAFLAGFEVSIVRASIMGIIVFSAQILGRQRLASYSLFFTGYSMLFLSPNIIYDIGFQLSFSATAGLIYIRPAFYKIGFLNKFLKTIWVGDDVSTTLSAQLATLPVLLANFGLYSFFSVFINALVLWTIPIIMIIGLFGLIFSIIFEPLGKLIMYLSLPLFIYFKAIVEVFSKISGTLTASYFPWQFALGYYLLLSGFVLALYKKKGE
jgi:competence protein ComEC